MRSGISHLSKRMEAERRQDFSGAAAATELERERLPDVASELDEPRWSVVSFDKHEAGGLTYTQATALVTELDGHGIHGLCVITDAAAKRFAT